MHKTATSTIQKFIYVNENILLQNNIRVLNIVDFNKSRILNHGIVLHSIFCDEPEKYHVNIRKSQDAQEVNKFYLQQIEEQKEHKENLLISGEGISIITKDQLHNLKNHFKEYNIKVIGYVRNPYSFHCSWCNQLVKGGIFTDFIKEESERSRFVANLVTVFSDVTFHSFESACSYKKGIVAHFLSLFTPSIHFNAQFELIDNQNESISNKYTRLLNYVNEKEPDVVMYKNNPIRHQFNPICFDFTDEKFLLTKMEFEQIENRMKREVIRLKELTKISYPLTPSFSHSYLISSDEAKTLSEKLTYINPRMRGLIWEYIQMNFAKKLSEKEFFDIKEAFFCNQYENVDTEILIETAKLWERDSANNALLFINMAYPLRPNGPHILKKKTELASRLALTKK